MTDAAVIVRLQGGLGNQLFQYAFGRAVAIRSAAPLVLDTFSGFQRDAYRRSYSLAPFAIAADILPKSQAFSSALRRYRYRLARASSCLVPLGQRRYVWERDPACWDPAVSALLVRRRTYFDGYWQHEDYFRNIRDRLLGELTLRSPPADACRTAAAHIAGPPAVAIHVRCLRHTTAGSVGPPRLDMDPGYYARAIALVAERIPDPRFYVFSDDPAWARQHLLCGHPCEYVAGGLADYEELWLMSRCRGLIIGNSTFSWWAAWLCQAADPRVVAPHAGSGKGLWTVPAGWQLL